MGSIERHLTQDLHDAPQHLLKVKHKYPPTLCANADKPICGHNHWRTNSWHTQHGLHLVLRVWREEIHSEHMQVHPSEHLTHIR